MNNALTTEVAKKEPENQPTQLPSRWALSRVLVLIAIMSCMCGLLTGVMTYRTVGMTDSFWLDWLRAFGTVILTVKPLALMSLWVVSRLVGYVMPHAKETTRNIVIGLIMACVMESIVAFMAAASHFGFTDYQQLMAGWWSGLMAALPVSLVVMPIMAITVKPKIKQFLNR
ncbi:DUF2798 domain-containing protein [Photobacterium japonica]|uniref:DUF2798 domain-containing protein n=1 Tax=Photobacterium japonica TaxID=2910235 RepID=UPI003D0AC825